MLVSGCVEPLEAAWIQDVREKWNYNVLEA